MESIDDRCYLSIIMVGRNDNYGGNFQSRLESCVHSLFQQLSKLECPSEIIFVNYNPLPSPKILDFIDWPKSTKDVKIRIIDVDPYYHKKFVNENKIKDVPVIEYLAKNIGIRRATGKFIACINPDIIFPETFFKELQNLNPNYFFRANRFDFVQTTEQLSHSNLLKFAKNNVIGIWLKGTSVHFEPTSINKLTYRRYKFQKWLMVNKYEFIRKLNFIWRKPLHFKAENKYHCNVSGDFMLMSRSIFFKLKGYYELAPIALHVDSLFVIQAASSGLKEKILNFPIYHQDHSRRYTSDRKNEIEDNAYIFFQQESESLLKNKKQSCYNTENWGLNSIILHEQYT